MPKKAFFDLGDDNSKEINKRICEIRTKRGLTQSDVAERLDMKTTTYSQMEREGRIPANRIVDIAEILDVDPMFLLNGVEPLRQEPALPKPEPENEPMELVLSNREKNNIEMLRNMKDEDREAAFKIIKELHDKKFKRKKS